jgi:hypothetical protein
MPRRAKTGERRDVYEGSNEAGMIDLPCSDVTTRIFPGANRESKQK